ncbi:MAG: hypothetical protein RBR21_07925 [Bacteroidales bacterium]|nr:hypothetical protein [Bacteroidales bacterium]
MKKFLILLVIMFGLFSYQAHADPPDTGQEITVGISHDIAVDFILPAGVVILNSPAITEATNSDVFIEDPTRLDIGETTGSNHSFLFIAKIAKRKFNLLVPY